MRTRKFNKVNWKPPYLQVLNSTQLSADGITIVAETYSHSNPELTNGNNSIEHTYAQPTLTHVLAMAPRMLNLLIRLEQNHYDLEYADELGLTKDRDEMNIAIEINQILSELERKCNE